MQGAEQRREDVGVELYGFQQHLGRLHSRLEATQKSTTRTTDTRKAADQQIAELREKSDAETQLTNKHRSEVGWEEAVSCPKVDVTCVVIPSSWCAQMEAFREDLDTLSNMHKQVEAHSRQQKSELAVTKRCAPFCGIWDNFLYMFVQGACQCLEVQCATCRITYATDEALQQLEKDKAEQDILLASLHQRIQTQKDAVQLYREQSAVQEKETQEVWGPTV